MIKFAFFGASKNLVAMRQKIIFWTPRNGGASLADLRDLLLTRTDPAVAALLAEGADSSD
jgi:hypothetical protein